MFFGLWQNIFFRQLIMTKMFFESFVKRIEYIKIKTSFTKNNCIYRLIQQQFVKVRRYLYEFTNLSQHKQLLKLA